MIAMSDAAQIVYKLLEHTGVINLGGIQQSVYDYAKSKDSNIEPTLSSENDEYKMAPDTSMDIDKLRKILDSKP